MVYQVNAANIMLFDFMSAVIQHTAVFFIIGKQKCERILFYVVSIIHYSYLYNQSGSRAWSVLQRTSMHNRVNGPWLSLCPSLPSSTVNIFQPCSY